MLVLIPQVLAPETVQEILAGLCDADYRDGRETARGGAATVKRNQQLTPRGELAQGLGQLVVDPLYAHPDVRAAAEPQRILMPMFSRYREAMSYGKHLDAPILGKSPMQLRTDISVTVFLSPPESYEGGELLLHVHGGTRAIKGKAGDVFIYPSDTVHEVTEVTKGERVVAVTWIQSMVRDAEKRQILYDFASELGALDKRGIPQNELIRLRRCHHALKRMWCET